MVIQYQKLILDSICNIFIGLFQLENPEELLVYEPKLEVGI